MKMSMQLRVTRIGFRIIQLILFLSLSPLLIKSRWMDRLFRGLVRTWDLLFTLIPDRYWPGNSRVKREHTIIEDVKVTWFIPDNLRHPDKMVLYVHGGALFLGSLASHSHVTAELATTLGCPVLFIDYGLAPEFPYPLGLNQLTAVYKNLISSRFKPADVIIGGDSAGGGLTISCLIKLRDEGVALPAAAFAESGIFDLTMSGASITENWFQECLLPSFGRPTRWFAQRMFRLHYAAGNELDHPYLSPLFADLSGLPPCYLACSNHEMLRDDTLRLTDRARAQGVTVTNFRSAGTPHANAVFFMFYPEARQGLGKIADFIRRELHMNAASVEA